MTRKQYEQRRNYLFEDWADAVRHRGRFSRELAHDALIACINEWVADGSSQQEITLRQREENNWLSGRIERAFR